MLGKILNLYELCGFLILSIMLERSRNVKIVSTVSININRITLFGSRNRYGECSNSNSKSSSSCDPSFLCLVMDIDPSLYYANYSLFVLASTPYPTEDYSFTDPGLKVFRYIYEDINYLYINYETYDEVNRVRKNYIGTVIDWIYPQIPIDVYCNPCSGSNINGVLWGQIKVQRYSLAETYRSISFILPNFPLQKIYDNIIKFVEDKGLIDEDNINIFWYINNKEIYFMRKLSSSRFLNNYIPSTYYTSTNFPEVFDPKGFTLGIIVKSKSYVEKPENNIPISIKRSINNMMEIYANTTLLEYPLKFYLKYYSRNYYGDSLSNICYFRNKDTFCDTDGILKSVRKYASKYIDYTKEYNPCKDSKCENEALCKIGSLSYECICQYGFYGKYCNKIYCNRNCKLCEKNKICYKCYDDYQGDNCSIKLCGSFDCGHGTCKILNNNRICQCVKNFFGERCNDTCSKECKNGECSFYNGYAYCQCILGYTGVNCEKYDTTIQVVYEKSYTFIYTMVLIAIVTCFIIIFIFIFILCCFKSNKQDCLYESHYNRNLLKKETKKFNTTQVNSNATNIEEKPQILCESNTYDNLENILENEGKTDKIYVDTSSKNNEYNIIKIEDNNSESDNTHK